MLSRSFLKVAWDDDPVVAAWTGRPVLDADVTADACVVGLGASGLTAVADLAQRGLSVVGIDAGRVGAGAAGRNGGFLLGGGAPFLHDAIARWGTEPAVALYRATLAELGREAAELGPDVVRRVGSIRLAGSPHDSDPVELGDCRAHAAALATHGVAVETYAGPLGAGLFLPDDAATNPARRTIELARRIGPPAVLYEHSQVRSVASGRVMTAAGTVSAGLVVVAVDGGLDALLPQVVSVVRTARLQMLATSPISVGLVPCPVYCRWGYDYAQQDGAGRLLVGGGRDRHAAAEWTREAAPTPPVQEWIEQVASRIAGASVEVTHRWASTVGFTLDGRPFCDEVAPGVVACGGYSGTGNLVGVLAARAAVALAVDGQRPPSWTTAAS